MAQILDHTPHLSQATETAPAPACGTGIRLAINGPRRSHHKAITLITLVLLAVTVRLPGISRPLLGQFATKNAIYAMIARNWASGRAPFWLPTVDCMAAGTRSWHLLEIPLAAYLAGEGWAVCGGSLDVWGRAVSVAFSAGAVTLLYLLVHHWHGNGAAYVAALILAVSPISILCGQSFMLEASTVFFMLLAMWSLEKWLTASSWRRWILAMLSVALMLCTKIYLAAMLLPLSLMAMRAASRADMRGHRRILGGWAAMAILAAVPAIIWCSAVASIASPGNPLSSHVYYSLWRSAAVNSIPSSLLFNADFYVHLLKGLAGAGLTPIGLLLALIGLCDKASRRHAGWLAALAMLVIVLPGKFFELRYYILILVPALSVLTGLGWNLLSSRLQARRLVAVSCLIAGLGCSLWLVAGPAWTTPREDRAVTAAAEAVREITPPGEPLATLHGAAPDLLYYCDRPGWALSVNDPHFAETLDQCRQSGARFLVVADMASLCGKPASDAVERLPIERAGDDYRIYRLPALAEKLSGPQVAKTAGRPATGRIR
jgi:hypothetical protein